MGRLGWMAVLGVALALGLLVLGRALPRGAPQPAPEEGTAGLTAESAPAALHTPAQSAGAGVGVARVAARESAAADQGATHVVRGVLVDARSGAPVGAGLGLGLVFTGSGGRTGLLRTLFGGRGQRLGPGVEFELESRAPEQLEARVVEWESGTELEREPHRYAAERQGDGSWRIAVDVGWFARLELLTPLARAPRVQSAQLIEVFAGEEHPWPRSQTRGRETDFVLYGEAAYEPRPGHRRFLEVLAAGEGGQWKARVEVPLANGLQPEPIRVPLAPLAFARGTVVDEHGEPCEEAVAQLLPAFVPAKVPAHAALWEESDSQGEFLFDELEPGPYRLSLALGFERAPEQELLIHAGENELGTFVLRGPRAAGALRGRLLSSPDDDPDGDPHGGEDPFALLVLRAQDGRELFAVAGFDLFGRAEGSSDFEFPRVPAGEYALEVLALDGRRYARAPTRVSAPSAELSIVADALSAVPTRLVLSDARSGARLEPRGILMWRAGRWLPGFVGADERLEGYDGEALVIVAEGHQPALFAHPAVERGADGARVLALALEPGWGRIVLARDLGGAPGVAGEYLAWFGPALSDLRVLADGREVTRTDGEGLALVALARAPAALEFERAGYRRVSAATDEGVQLVLCAPE